MRTVLVAAVCSAVAGLGMAPSSVLAKTVNECRAEWQAHKDIFQPKGISEHDYIDECRGFPATAPETPAATNAAPAAAVPAQVKPARAAVAAPVGPSERAATRQGADTTKKPEARAEFNSKLPPRSSIVPPATGTRNSMPVASPQELGPECLSRHSGSIIHSERCGF